MASSSALSENRLISKTQDLPCTQGSLQFKVSDTFLASRKDDIGQQSELPLQLALHVLRSGGAKLLSGSRSDAEVARALAQDDVCRMQLPLQGVEERCAGRPRLQSDGFAVEAVMLGGG